MITAAESPEATRSSRDILSVNVSIIYEFGPTTRLSVFISRHASFSFSKPERTFSYRSHANVDRCLSLHRASEQSDLI